MNKTGYWKERILMITMEYIDKSFGRLMDRPILGAGVTKE